MVFLGQFTGVNAVMYYMGMVMNNIGFSNKNDVFMSLVGCWARSWCCTWKNSGVATGPTPCSQFFIGLLLVGIGYQIPLAEHPKVAEGVYLTGLILYMGFFSGCMHASPG